jgi:hypothetical protein
MFQCAKCHPAGAEAAAAAGAASVAELAPSLLLASGRLRHGWVPSWIKDPQKWIPGTRMPSNFPEVEPGRFMSPAVQAINMPLYAAHKQRLLPYFGSQQALDEYLGDVDRVTTALRDYLWRLSAGRPALGPSTDPGAGAALDVAAAGDWSDTARKPSRLGPAGGR